MPAWRRRPVGLPDRGGTVTAAAFPLSHLLAVAAGAAAGGVTRWAVGVWLQGQGPGFPVATLVVNAIGGFLIGLALVAFARQPNEVLRLLVVTGFLGGLTTFSAFSAESLGLLQRGELGSAAVHAAGHVLLSLAAAALGVRLGGWVWA
jgi:fluoride exporter